MPVPSARTDLSTTAASNSPAGTDSIGTSHDDHMRQQYKFIRENYDDIQLKANIASPTFTGTVTGPGYTVTGSSAPANGIYLSAANTFAISSNSTIRYTINSTGNHSIAAPSSGVALTVEGPIAVTGDASEFRAMDRDGSGYFSWYVAANSIRLYDSVAPLDIFSVDRSGNGIFVGTVTATDVVETSAREVKENIATAESGALERIQALAIKEFEFKQDASKRKRVGVIADEVPSRYSVNGEAVSLTAILFDLVKAVQELAAK